MVAAVIIAPIDATSAESAFEVFISNIFPSDLSLVTRYLPQFPALSLRHYARECR